MILKNDFLNVSERSSMRKKPCGIVLAALHLKRCGCAASDDGVPKLCYRAENKYIQLAIDEVREACLELFKEYKALNAQNY